jgi:2-dehydro-3-deoxyglucarate aldolase/4-hydroxy-2-oxoheptanedioate aldolase
VNALRVNLLKRAMRDGTVTLGCGVHEARDPGVIFALAQGGADVVFIDLEHHATSLETTGDLVAFAHAAGVTPMVRIAQIDQASVTRVLDSGCQTIFVPNVKTREEVERVLDLARYAPLGHRSMNMAGNANVGYMEVTDVAGAAQWLNDQLLVGLNIETREAVANLDDLLIEGVDWAMVGLFDLSQSYGLIGQHATHPLIADAMTKVRELCRERNIGYVAFAANAEHASQLVADGASMVLMGGVLDYVRQGAARAKAAVRGAPSGPR